MKLRSQMTNDTRVEKCFASTMKSLMTWEFLISDDQFNLFNDTQHSAQLCCTHMR